MKEFLINWYRRNKRDLPWRNTKNPYKIWLSEVILQQTRVNQGLSYYNIFITRFPTVDELAKASIDEVLKLWQGLGYYSRARNLHKTATYIYKELNSEFPTLYKDIIKLPGVGPYTAAAIASFSFNEAKAVLDGNVYRVLSRLYNIHTPINTTAGKKEFGELAEQLLDKENPGEYNQAIMEFGALQCKPVSPNCEICPLIEKCLAFSKDNIQNLPVKEKKTKVKERFFTFLIVKQNNTLLIQKRTEKDIWQSLYQFPLIETKTDFSSSEEEFQKELEAFFKESLEILFISKTFTHILSHQKLKARYIHVNAMQKIKNDGYVDVAIEELGNYAIPRLLEIITEDEYFQKNILDN